MRVTIFGATGAIGQLTVDELLRRGHHVVAYVRNPAKVPPHWRDRVRVIVGELSDASGIDEAIAGADAVVSTLGPKLTRATPGLPLVDGMKAIVTAMNRHGIQRFVGNATPSVLDPRERPTFRTRFIALLARAFLRRAHEEMTKMAAIVMGSELDWTIVRFITPKDGPPLGIRHEGFFGRDRLGWSATRADIAAFTASLVDNDRYLLAAPAISN